MKKDAFKSYWRENLEHRSNSDMIKTETKQKKGEITMSRKASMLVSDRPISSQNHKNI